MLTVSLEEVRKNFTNFLDEVQYVLDTVKDKNTKTKRFTEICAKYEIESMYFE